MKSRLYSLVRSGSILAILAWAGAIFYLSSLGQKEIEPLNMPIPYWDKFLHIVAFATGGGLMASALRIWTTGSNKRVFIAAVILIAIYGATDEWHQLYTPGRSGADLGDWSADITGALLGSWILLKAWPTSLLKLLNSGS